jgi:hypothetical protein
VAPLSQDRNTLYEDDLRRDTIGVCNDSVIYNGAAVAVNAAGYAIPAGTAGGMFRGIADETVDPTDGNDGDLNIQIICPDAAIWDHSGLGVSDLDSDVYFSDDHTVTTTHHAIYAGRVRKIVSTALVLVDHRGAYSGMTGQGTALTSTTGS